jgi:hypothetical protein
MSDLVDRLIVECFSPKKGLAKRLETDKATALKLNAKKKLEASRLVERAELEAQRLIEEADSELQEAIKAAESSWEGSIQSFLLRHLTTEETVAKKELTNRWLFDNYIFAAKDRFDEWKSCGGVCDSMSSYMYNPLIKDKLLAADIAADTSMYSVSTDVVSYLASCYDNSLDKLYAAFDSATVADGVFFKYCNEADKLYGSKLLAHFADRITREERAAAEVARVSKVVDNHLTRLTLKDIAEDLRSDLAIRNEAQRRIDLAASTRV